MTSQEFQKLAFGDVVIVNLSNHPSHLYARGTRYMIKGKTATDCWSVLADGWTIRFKPDDIELAGHYTPYAADCCVICGNEGSWKLRTLSKHCKLGHGVIKRLDIMKFWDKIK